MRSKNLLVAAGVIDLAVTAYAAAVRVEDPLVPMLVGGATTVALLLLGALRHRGFLYAYLVLLVFGIVSQAFAPDGLVNIVVAGGLSIASVLVALYLQRCPRQGFSWSHPPSDPGAGGDRPDKREI
jgi:hypothetical protein